MGDLKSPTSITSRRVSQSSIKNNQKPVVSFYKKSSLQIQLALIEAINEPVRPNRKKLEGSVNPSPMKIQSKKNRSFRNRYLKTRGKFNRGPIGKAG